jgi:hypothetical protein
MPFRLVNMLNLGASGGEMDFTAHDVLRFGAPALILMPVWIFVLHKLQKIILALCNGFARNTHHFMYPCLIGFWLFEPVRVLTQRTCHFHPHAVHYIPVVACGVCAFIAIAVSWRTACKYNGKFGQSDKLDYTSFAIIQIIATPPVYATLNFVGAYIIMMKLTERADNCGPTGATLKFVSYFWEVAAAYEAVALFWFVHFLFNALKQVEIEERAREVMQWLVCGPFFMYVSLTALGAIKAGVQESCKIIGTDSWCAKMDDNEKSLQIGLGVGKMLTGTIAITSVVFLEHAYLGELRQIGFAEDAEPEESWCAFIKRHGRNKLLGIKCIVTYEMIVQIIHFALAQTIYRKDGSHETLEDENDLWNGFTSCVLMCVGCPFSAWMLSASYDFSRTRFAAGQAVALLP